jgi:hypothetical protein
MTDNTSVPLKKWSPPDEMPPSIDHHGAITMEPVWTAVGRALSEWEHTESGLMKLFQVFCETRSLAACRALGTVESAAGRY